MTESFPTKAMTPLTDLEPAFAARIALARTADGWDSEALRREVSRAYGLMGPFVLAWIEKDSAGRELLVTELNPPSDRDLDTSARAYEEACAAANEGNLSRALGLFERLVHEFPEVPEYGEGLGQALQELRRGDEAEAVLKRVLELDPQRPNALALLARISDGRGDLKRAIELTEASLELAPHPVIFSNLGAFLGKAGRTRNAIQAFEKALALDPRYQPAQMGLKHAKELLRGGF